MTPAEQAGDIAQQIQDLYFSLGAKINIDSWNKTEKLLLSEELLLSERTRLEGLCADDYEKLLKCAKELSNVSTQISKELSDELGRIKQEINNLREVRDKVFGEKI